MTQINIEIEDTTVLSRLSELSAALTPAGMRVAYGEIGEQLVDSTQRRFDTSTAPDGSPWAPLKAGTVLAALQTLFGNREDRVYKKNTRWGKKGEEKKDVKTFRANRKPLVATGLLQGNVHHQVNDGGVDIGTNRFVGDFEPGEAVHQFGSKNGRIPARPFLGLSASDKTTVLEIVGRHLRGGALHSA